MQPNNKKLKRTNVRRRRVNRPRRKRNNQNKVIHISEVGRICPSRTVVRLRWTDQTVSRSATSLNAQNWRYQSSAYDPDPSLGTGAIPGFVELSNLYAEYRVLSMRLRITPMSHEINPVVLVIWPSTAVHNTNSLAQSDLIEYGSNVYGKMIPCPSTSSGNLRSLSGIARGGELIGRQFYTDISYSSSTSNSPVNMYNWNVGLFTSNQTNFAFTSSVLAQITYEVEFFTRRDLES